MGLAYVNFAAKRYCSWRGTSPVTENFPRFVGFFLEELFGGPERRGKGEGVEDSGRVAGKRQSQRLCTVNMSKAVRGGGDRVWSYAPSSCVGELRLCSSTVGFSPRIWF